MDLTLLAIGPMIYLVPRKEVMTFPAKRMGREVGGGSGWGAHVHP